MRGWGQRAEVRIIKPRVAKDLRKSWERAVFT